jgi:hypothetical protein
LKANVLPNTLLFEGILDEQTSEDHLRETLEKVKKAGIKPPLNLDFSKVTYANSAGVVIWLKFANKSGIAFKYINAPVWLVNQFNMISDYFVNQSFVETLSAPYFAPKSQDSIVFTLKVGKDIPILENYADFKMPNRAAEGKVYEIDFDPGRYFSFISENYQLFKTSVR